MALATEVRLKRMMVYRLEEQLRLISQDDNYAQILASLSRCVQSLLVPPKEKGHDGSGDATSINPFSTLDELLIHAPRSENVPARDKLLVLLADALSVVFATIADLKPGPVSRHYLDSVVEEELALAGKTQGAYGSSSASNVITQLTGSSGTESCPVTVSGANSSMSASAVSPVSAPAPTAAPNQSNWGQQQQTPAPVQTQAANFGSQQQPANTGFGNQPNQSSGFASGQQMQQANSGYGQQSSGFASGAQPTVRASPIPPQEPVVGISFGTKSLAVPTQPQLQSNPPAPVIQQAAPITVTQSQPSQFNQAGGNSQQAAPSFGTHANNLAAQPQQQQFQAPAQAAPSFGTSQQQSAIPQQPAPSFGTQQQPAFTQQQTPQQPQFGTQPQPAFTQQPAAPQQPQFGTGLQQQQHTAPQQPAFTQQQTPQQPQFGTQPQPAFTQQQSTAAPQQPQFGTGLQQQQPAAPQQPAFTQQQTPQQPQFGTQPQPAFTQQPAAPQQSQFSQQPAFTQQQQTAAPQQPQFGTQQQPAFNQQQTSAPQQPQFGTQQQQPAAAQQAQFGTPQQPQFGTQQQQQNSVPQQQQFQAAPQAAFGSSAPSTSPPTESSQPTAVSSNLNVTSSGGSQMTSMTETDGSAGSGMYNLPVKKPVADYDGPLINQETELNLYDWKDYVPIKEGAFGNHVIPTRGAYNGGGGRGGGRGGGFDGGRGAPRGGGRGGYEGGRGAPRGRGGF